MIGDIIDCCKLVSTIENDDAYITSSRGRQKKKFATKRWWFLVDWKYGNQSQAQLKYTKDTNTIKVTEYSNFHDLREEPAFTWWFPFTLNKRGRIIYAMDAKPRNK